jgi:hypothetical protein
MLLSGFSAILKKLFLLLLCTVEHTLGSTVLHPRQTLSLKDREECPTDHSISFPLVDFTRIALNCVACW